MTEWTLTVSDLNEYVRKSLASDPMLRSIRIKGEISNFKRHISGHLYFSLKDEQSRIACVMFRQSAMRLRFAPRDGLNVVLTGSAALYLRDGAFQFYADDMREEGVGALYEKFEILKARLMAEGLFDEGRKRPLPLLPRMVGIVTSRTGAVVHDISQVSLRRNRNVPLLLCAAQVQGEDAKEEIVRAINALCRIPQVDVIIIGRGGGSLEDLWAFNEKMVVRAVAACPVPVISAVGHETDVVLTDFAADSRAATPSAAAEIAVPQKEALLDAVAELQLGLRQALESDLMRRKNMLAQLEKRLQAQHPLIRMQNMAHRVQTAKGKLNELMEKKIASERAQVTLFTDKLGVLGPQKALSRGYALVMRQKEVLTQAAQMRVGDELNVRFSDGLVKARVDAIEMGDYGGGKKEGTNL